MTHNWNPGDVANYDGHRVMLTMRAPGREAWIDDEGDERLANPAGWDRVLRPLLVIDPEDRAQIMRLAEAWDAQTDVTLEDGEPMSLSGWHMQAALRSLLESEPEEPTGLGAVVQSDDGSVWVRGHDSRTGWVRTAFVNETWAWSDLPRPLTVLAPGYVGEGSDD